jgi:hypothetical protein
VKAVADFLSAFVLTVICVILVLALKDCVFHVCSIRAAKGTAENAIEIVEDYRVANGVYPDEMPQQAALFLDSQPLEWKYFQQDGGSAFTLLIGDYDKNNFELLWNSERARWVIDE